MVLMSNLSLVKDQEKLSFNKSGLASSSISK